ncbi:hypothetical protein NEOLEDRAFT_1183420 [Neolentinus lepideus HHB14362 ss-1]|uniref:Uncharacterized protein n=1 Tax=Neolentinus lepideus HHB14362 ss-1 TaxID=1314782 RepID=A0A165NAB6_9AGAM|nr:hypothetical protein NEOLEDRAFT_1183420 [Neolentinus lepideus HHB14362 ss-1]
MANIEDQSKGITDSVEKGALLQERPGEAAALVSSNGLPAVVMNGVVSEVRSEGGLSGKEDGDMLKNSGSTTVSTSAATPAPNGTIGTNHAAGSLPHLKKFSAVNINKKFLEKNASLPGSSQTVSASSSVKSGSTAPRPTPEASNSHSRLVTAKLTSTPRPSSTTGPGWSRPSSVAPSPSTPAPPMNVNKPSTLPANPTTPQFPVVGKVIQPQPRASVTGSSSTVLINETLSITTRPAWGNLKNGPAASLKPDVRVQSDFPTAAEVAQVRASRLNDRKAAAEEDAVHKQALQEDADTFRGVHLDPNAHHWDEMEEDDENFLGGVIDFGDGRQYKIQPSDASAVVSGAQQPPKPSVPDEERRIEAEVIVPVSKKERFIDDFDRSWPRSRPTLSSNQSDISTSSQPLRSPLESSRVLFNERSNRLEPYSGPHQVQRHGSPNQLHPSLSSRRSSRSDQVTSPIDMRSPRDLPPHGHQMHNVSLLQKPEASSSRSRGPLPVQALSQSMAADRWREPIIPRGSGLAPPLSRTVSQGSNNSRGQDHYNPLDVHGERPRDPAFESRRLSASHPPPVPPPFAQPSREAVRQMPPHLMDQSHDRPSPTQPVSLQPPQAAVLPPAELIPEATPVASVVIDEETRKAAMHSAAERARLRRQQGEEERERERERARRKAAELEEKMKAIEAEKTRAQVDEPKQDPVSEQQVIQVIEDAVRPKESIAGDSHASAPTNIDQEARSPVGRTASQRSVSQSALPRPSAARKTSFPAGNPTAPSMANEADSWRNKATVFTPEAPTSLQHQSAVGQLAVQPFVIPEVESLSVGPDEQLEEFDFADLGKLVGGGRSPAPLHPNVEDAVASRVRPLRPVASDFFDSSPQARREESSWRRKTEPIVEPASSTSATSLPLKPLGPSEIVLENLPETMKDVSNTQTTSISVSMTGAVPMSPNHHGPRTEHTHVLSQSVHSQASVSTLNQRSPRFKEASMSTLDDTMSRIKGVLDDMHVHDHDAKHDDLNLRRASAKSKAVFGVTQTELPPKPKFIPPALRSKLPPVYGLPTPDEVFDVTGIEPPRSPKPAWNAFVVRLPKQSRPVEPLPKRQITQLRNNPHPIWWDILSWNPPVEGMSRRLLSVDAVLFPRGKPRYRVLLPRIRSAGTEPGSDSQGLLGPTVNLPFLSTSKAIGNSALSVGAFGRPRGADTAMSWRQAPRTSTEQRAMESSSFDPGLETVSRSPPPDPPLALPSSRPGDLVHGAAPEAQESRSRSQPKMPFGSGVAFYKDARVNFASADVKPSVNFTVTSELEELETIPSMKTQRSSGIILEQMSAASTDVPPVSVTSPPVMNGFKTHRPKVDRTLPDDLQDMSPRKAQDEPTSKADSVSQTTHAADTTWGKSSLMLSVKDSLARGPDPEHLKAVWSQASDKANLPSINSLEGIGDDLTALPFTVTEVKSEDGETPPPTAPGISSRMSVQDVTRAFQQVPSSSSGSSTQRTSLSPPSNFSAPRPVPLPYPPPPQPGMRPAYAAYPSPMLNSPSPVVYPTHMAPSPVPGRIPMNGPAPQYSQVWVPVPPPPHGGMMRAVPAPYGSPFMAYPSPISATSMYPVPAPPMHMQSPPAPQPNGSSNRPGAMSMMSPIMSHATPENPMYTGSPVMVHASHLPVPQSYTSVAPSHTQQRSPYDNAPRPTGHQQPSGYASTPPTAFARSAW